MSSPLIDARQLQPWERHTVIFEKFDNLPRGDDFILVTDHDPLPLFHQFQSSRSKQFGWSYIEKGPEAWQIRISRIASPEPQSDGNCCGHCGG